MSAADDTNKVKNNISAIFERKRLAIFAISLYYAAEALNYFKAEQAGQAYWDNQTKQAMDTVFSNARMIGKDSVGWFIAHHMEYGVYLELSNNRKHEALRPIIEKFKTRYMWAAGELYKNRPEVGK